MQALGSKLRLKARHKLELEKIHLVQMIYAFLLFHILDLARADISIKLGIRKSEIVLVSFTAKSVGGHLFDQLTRQIENTTDLKHLCNRKTRQRAEIAYRISVARGISHPILAEIAGVDNATVTAL